MQRPRGRVRESVRPGGARWPSGWRCGSRVVSSSSVLVLCGGPAGNLARRGAAARAAWRRGARGGCRHAGPVEAAGARWPAGGASSSVVAKLRRPVAWAGGGRGLAARGRRRPACGACGRGRFVGRAAVAGGWWRGMRVDFRKL